FPEFLKTSASTSKNKTPSTESFEVFDTVAKFLNTATTALKELRAATSALTRASSQARLLKIQKKADTLGKKLIRAHDAELAALQALPASWRKQGAAPLAESASKLKYLARASEQVS